MAVMELWRRRDLEGTVKPEYVDGNFFTQDSVGNLVGVKCYKDGAEVALTGSVTGYCVLPSGETVSVAGTRSGNQASILVPQSALAYTGPLGITLKLIDGNTITTLMRIIVVVYRSKTDTVITPSSQIITDWANQISAALQEVEDASAAQDEKIDDLKSAITEPTKNIFAGDYLKGFINTSNNTIATNVNGAIVYAPCVAGKTYTVSKTAGKRFIVGTTASLPVIGVAVSDIVSNGTASYIRTTASNGAQYIIAFVWLSTADTGITLEQMLASVQIEEGSTPTDYVPHLSAVDRKAREDISNLTDFDSDVSAALVTLAHDKFATLITNSSDDLNNYTTPGNYIVGSSTMAQSIAHCPATVAGRLFVMSNNDNLHIVQLYVDVNPDTFIYKRQYINGTWSDWKRLVTKPELDSVNTTISSLSADLDALESGLETTNEDLASLDYKVDGIEADVQDIDNNTIPGMQNAIQAKATKSEVDSALLTERNARMSAITDLESDIVAEQNRATANEARIEALFTGDVVATVNAWIAANPDKMINLQDHSVGANKLAYGALNYVTPEMFGAVGDGVTDDSAAIKAASAYAPVYCGKHTYLIDDDVTLVHGLIGGTFNMTLDKTLYAIGSDFIEFAGCTFYSTELPSSDSRGKWQLYLSHCDGARVTHCHFKRGVSGLYIDRSKNVMVDHNLFTDYPQLGLEAGGNGYGVLTVECQYVDIDSNHFIDVARHAVYISHDMDGSSTYNKHIRIRNNSFIWTANVQGATSGFEVPINVRPAINIIIENNYFENVMSIATFNRQTIKVNGEDAFVGSEDIYIRGNIGYFKNTVRKDGVVFISSSSDTDLYPSTKNIHIENNTVKAEYGHFVCADNFDGLYIKGNTIECLEGGVGVVVCKFKRKDILRNLCIVNNEITMLNGRIFATNNFGTNPERLDYGDFVFDDNVISGIYSIGYFPTLPDGIQHSFQKFSIVNNKIDFTHNRDYWGNPSIAVACLKGNALNEQHGLYLGTPTKITNVDPAFNAYSGANSNPADATVGNLNVINGDDVYIKTNSTWIKIS